MNNKIAYSISGLFVGLLLGSLLGLGELFYTKKSQRETGLPFFLIGGGLIGAAIGISVGYKYGLSKHINEITGIDKAKTVYLKQGQFWIASTVWTDTRNQKEFQILTGRSNQNILVSSIEDRVIIKYETTSASKVSVEKYHKQSIHFVFSALEKSFDNKVTSNLNDLFPTVS
jgi:hypothetical protein